MVSSAAYSMNEGSKTADLLKMERKLQRFDTEGQAQRLFYSLYPDDQITWDTASNRHFARGALFPNRYPPPRAVGLLMPCYTLVAGSI